MIAKILGYGVMVTLQILVLSFLVRIRVSQQHVNERLSEMRDALFLFPRQEGERKHLMREI